MKKREITSMCRASVLFTAYMVLCTCTARAETTFPYSAYIKASNASVRSGPSEKFYATSRLIWGSKVEVHRHLDEWCAIRPPESSFSWVRKEALTLTGQSGIAKVVGDDTVTRVGTVFGDDHHVEYVKLSENEVVEVLGSKRLADPSGESVARWYKILPPAGEFRWIHRQDLSADPPSGEHPRDEADATLPRIAEQALQEPDRLPENLNAKPIQLVDSRSSTEAKGISLPESKEDEWRERVDATSAVGTVQAVAVTQLAAEVDSKTITDGRWRETNSPFREITPSVDGDRLDQLDLALSEAVADPLSLWELDGLGDQIQQLIDRSESSHDRDRARELLTKLNEFQDIKRRYDTVTDKLAATIPAAFTAPQKTKPLQRLARGLKLPKIIGSGVRTAANAANGKVYDGTGWLMPVVTERTGVPRYALTDENGHIVSFVSPATGVNLRRYERQQVGIIGKRGYVPKLNRSHVTAERVVMLERHRR